MREKAPLRRQLTQGEVRKLSAKLDRLDAAISPLIEALQEADRLPLADLPALPTIRANLRTLASLLTVAETRAARPARVMGRPVVYQADPEEQARYKRYADQGLSLRAISDIEKCGKDTARRKLAAYQLSVKKDGMSGK